MISGVDGKWTAKIEDIARPKILHANRLGDTLIKGIADLQLRLLLKDRDLLRARSGGYNIVDFETELMAKDRPPRGSHAPGTFWYYILRS
jgi:hypothetical protein